MIPLPSKKIHRLFLLITAILCAAAWWRVFQPPEAPLPGLHPMTGKTMGTQYHVTLAGALSAGDLAALQADLDAELRRINRIFSPYDPASEISALNGQLSTNPIAMSAEFTELVRQSLDLAARTGGAFDPTVAPLVNLWGFGPQGRSSEPPSEADVAAAQARCGWSNLLLSGQTAVKKIPDLQLDLSAIAKGRGVDAACEFLRQRGWTNHVVEIGGEARASGRKPDGSSWRIGIQKPSFGALHGDHLIGILELSDTAVATSGDYQNFFTASDGRIYSHILDPRTGYPVEHATASVTVIAPDCALADGLATALYVMGPDRGLELVDALDNVEALFVVRESEDTLTRRASRGFPACAP